MNYLTTWIIYNLTIKKISEDQVIKVKVTEYIPWANCTEEKKDGKLTWSYMCEVPKWGYPYL